MPTQEEHMPHLMLRRSPEAILSLPQCHRIPSLQLDRRANGLHIEWEVAPVGLTDPTAGHVCRVLERHHDIRLTRRENLGNEVRTCE